MSNEEHWRKLERMYASAPVNAHFGPTLRVGDGEAHLAFPVRPEFFHGGGSLHGCVAFKALDDAAVFAVASLVRDFLVVTASFQIYLLRPVADGEVRATGRVVSRSRRLFVAESEATDDRGRVLARGSGTFVKSALALSADLGYA